MEEEEGLGGVSAKPAAPRVPTGRSEVGSGEHRNWAPRWVHWSAESVRGPFLVPQSPLWNLELPQKVCWEKHAAMGALCKDWQPLVLAAPFGGPPGSGLHPPSRGVTSVVHQVRAGAVVLGFGGQKCYSSATEHKGLSWNHCVNSRTDRGGWVWGWAPDPAGVPRFSPGRPCKDLPSAPRSFGLSRPLGVDLGLAGLRPAWA